MLGNRFSKELTQDQFFIQSVRKEIYFLQISEIIL